MLVSMAFPANSIKVPASVAEPAALAGLKFGASSIWLVAEGECRVKAPSIPDRNGESRI